MAIVPMIPASVCCSGRGGLHSMIAGWLARRMASREMNLSAIGSTEARLHGTKRHTQSMSAGGTLSWSAAAR